MIYFVQLEMEEGPIKIGFTSSSMYRRLDSVRSFLPWGIKTLGYMAGGKEEERELHKKFRKFRIRGEWFRPNDRLLDFIEENKLEEEPKTQKKPTSCSVRLTDQQHKWLEDTMEKLGTSKSSLVKKAIEMVLLSRRRNKL